jgi:hypothetical protein
MAKRTGIPAREQYTGKLYGSWGMIGAILCSADMPPIVQGAAIEAAMSGGQVVPVQQQRSATTREELREIALRHLPNLRKVARVV